MRTINMTNVLAGIAIGIGVFVLIARYTSEWKGFMDGGDVVMGLFFIAAGALIKVLGPKQ